MSSGNQFFDYEPISRTSTSRRLTKEKRDRGEDSRARSKPAGDSPAENLLADNLSAEDVDQELFPRSTSILENKIKKDRSGHGITYVCLFLFTFVVFARPADWYPNAFTLTFTFYIGVLTLGAYFITQFSLEGNLTARPREVYYALALLLTGFLSIPLADQDRGVAYDTFMDTFVRAILIYIVLVNTVRTERRLRWLMMISLGVGVYLSGKALTDYLTGNLAVEGYRVAGAIGGMFGNPNDMSQHLVGMVPIAVAFMLTSRSLLRRSVFAVCSILLLCGIVVTFSRGGFLALMAITFLLTWKLGKRHRVLFTIFAVILCVGLVAAAPGEYRTRLLSIFDNSLEVASGSAQSRRDLLKESIKVTLRHPVLGIGMGNFRLIYKLVTHNAYTQVASEIGLFGFAAYVLFIVNPLKRLREIERATAGDPAQRNFYFLAIGLQATLVGYMVSSFFGAVAYYFNIYYLIGYAVSLRLIYYNMVDVPLTAQGLPKGSEEVANLRPAASAAHHAISGAH